MIRLTTHSGIALTLVAVAVAVVFMGMIGGVAGIGTVSAGDSAAILFFDPEEIAAEPGDTVSVDVKVGSDGGYGGAGVANVSTTVFYHPAVLEAVDVEPGSWLEGDNHTVVTETVVDEDNGTIALSQERESVESGVTGMGTIATITFAVDPGAPASSVTVYATGSSVNLANHHRQWVWERDSVILIAGGDSKMGSDRTDQDRSDEGTEGITLATDVATDAEQNDSESGPADSSAVNTDRFGSWRSIVIGVGLVFVVLVAIVRYHRSSVE